MSAASAGRFVGKVLGLGLAFGLGFALWWAAFGDLFKTVFAPSITCRAADLRAGMPRDDVMRLCGKPKRINYDGPYGGKIKEQWVYGSRKYIYVEGGVFSSMQWSEE